MIASCGTRLLLRVRVRANTAAPKHVNAREKTNASRESGAAPYSSATTLPSAAIWASERSTKITPRAMICSPRYEWMATRIMHATKGATMNASTGSPRLATGGGRCGAKPLRQRLHPDVHEADVRLGAGLAAGVPRHDHRLRTRARRHFADLVTVVVAGGQEHLNLLLLHLFDHLLDMARRGRDPRLRLDVVHARHTELAGEVVPFLVIAHHRLATEDHA